ncbi:MAG TPA: MrpF/PhaF family protein [Baekduia sp.]|nr:MrpF/PhaF family protein [Baekduia sp.]
MSPWLIAATVLLVALLAPLWVCVRAPIMDALVALELAGVVTATVLLLLAEGFHRTTLFDPAIVAAVMSLIGSLIYVRLLERRV